MDQIQSSSSYHQLPPSASSSASSAARQHLQQHIQQQQRLLAQQQQLYNHSNPPSFSSSNTLAPIPPPQQPQHYFAEGLSPTHTSPPTSASAANWQRTSNSREELHPRQQQQYIPQPPSSQQLQQEQPIKRESMSYASKDDILPMPSTSNAAGAVPRSGEDPMPATSDFVKKLYKMLEDPSFQSVVCWGPLGDCFVVKDMNEFTKSILPRMFKHSNFASFVRQLNKYDFHKVKNTDDNTFGEHSWTFRHPDFHADRRDALENIKRKVPAARKQSSSTALSGSSSGGPSSSHPLSSHPYRRSPSPSASLNGHSNGHSVSSSSNTAVLTAEIQRLKDEGDDLRGRIRNLERNYENVLVEMVGFQRGMAQQDGLMQSLIAYFLGSESGKQKAAKTQSSSGNPSSNSPSSSGVLRATPAVLPIGTNAVAGSSSSSTSPSVQRQNLQPHIQLQLQQTQNTQAALSAQLEARLKERQNGEPQQRSPQQPTSSSSLADWSALSEGDTSNPFLPPQIVQRILGSSSGSQTPTGGANLTPGFFGVGANADVGRASLMQMSELSRRATYLNANGGGAGVGPDGRLWSGMNFGVDSAGQQQPQDGGPAQTQNPGIKLTRAEALSQIRDLHRERLTQGGWANAPVPAMGLGGVGMGPGIRRSMSEERERLRERDRSGLGMPLSREDTGPLEQEQDRGRTLRPRRRQSESAASLSSGGGMLADISAASPEGYTASSQSPASSQGQQQDEDVQQQQSSSRQGSDTPSNSSWPPLMTTMEGGPFRVDASTSQPYGDSATQNFSGMLGAQDDDGMTHEGLQVYTVGHLLPRGMGGGGEENQGGNGWNFDLTPGADSQSRTAPQAQQEFAGEDEIVQPTPSNGPIVPGPMSVPIPSSSAMATTPGTSSQKLRVRRSTFVPGWAVPPRVLLVDDDAVSRKLSSKFLQVFGCTTDIAVDGIGAVNKMNLEKYDLVLMDIVMPKLDGVSATNLIRKFDQGTPIISMTSNSKPNEIMTYYSSGMNDILPKPFTKEGLLDMLEKHLMHLKVIQQMSRIPRSVGVPPLSDANFEQALTTNANYLMVQQGQTPSASSSSLQSSSNPSASLVANAPSPFNFSFGFNDPDDGRINPLAGMGLTDEQYNMILQNIVNGDGFMGVMEGVSAGDILGAGEKRSLEDPSEDGRDGKRSRFEVVE